MKKPPIGVTPKSHHDYQRAVELQEAIQRYLTEGLPIKPEWVEEYNELLKTITL